MKSQAGRLRVMVSAAILVVSVLVSSTSSNAQNCGKRKFLFRGCDASGNMITKCSECPNDEPGFTPYKRPRPCFKLPVARPGKIDYVEGGQSYHYYDPKDMEGELFYAEGLWLGLEHRSCSVQLPGCDVCVQIVLSQNTSDFNNDETLLKRDFLNRFTYNPNTCKYECNGFDQFKEYMFINMNNSHMYGNNGKWKRLPYTGLIFLPISQQSSDFEAVSMVDLLIAAMGDFWGFAPQRGASCGNTDPYDYWLTDGAAPSSKFRTFVTQDDASICMFRRLYCPGEDPYCFSRAVDENGKEIPAPAVEIAVSPNPSPRNVECLITSEVAASAPASVFDAAGNQVSGPMTLNLKPGTRPYRLDTDLPAGSYILVVSVDGVNHVKQFVVLPK